MVAFFVAPRYSCDFGNSMPDRYNEMIEALPKDVKEALLLQQKKKLERFEKQLHYYDITIEDWKSSPDSIKEWIMTLIHEHEQFSDELDSVREWYDKFPI